MTFTLRDLDARTRNYMLDELNNDLRDDCVFTSRWLRDDAVQTFQELLEIAFERDTPTALAFVLRAESLLIRHHVRHTARGEVLARVPRTAETTLAHAAFNHYYIRALCVRALRYGMPQLIVCRARQPRVPRPDSQSLVGMCVGAQALLNDLRLDEPKLGIPAGPNSSLTVRLPRINDGVLGIPLLAVTWDDDISWAA